MPRRETGGQGIFSSLRTPGAMDEDCLVVKRC